MEWPHSEILAHHTHQASGYETYCSSTNTITDAHNAGLQLRFPLPWPRLWLTFHLHEAFWVRDRACKEWDNWSFPSWLESVVAFPLNHTEFRFAALDFTGSSVRNKSLQVWWFTAALETEFLMTEWLIFSLEKQKKPHAHMHASRRFALVLLPFLMQLPPLSGFLSLALWLDTQSLYTEGHFSRLEDILRFKERAGEFWAAP